MTEQAEFGKSFRRYLNVAGEVVQKMPNSATNPRSLVPLYEAMMLTRSFDEKAVSLQRTGKLGTYPSSLGQEAVGVGVAAAMQPEDILLPSFREQSAMLWRGVTMTEILQYWGGQEVGNNFSCALNDFPICVPVGTHFTHAAGVGFALKHKNTESAAVVIAGDGATSKGDFYEAMNVAGVWQLPVVFVITNNQWAISVPRSRQTAAETLAQKALSAGMNGFQVDGNDVVAVREIISEALNRARKNHIPSLIEAVTYRLTDHTTADDASRYRSDEEVSEHWGAEPIKRLRNYLQEKAGWSSSEEESLQTNILQEIDVATKAYLSAEPENISNAFDYLYAEIPATLDIQRQAAMQRVSSDA